MSHQYTTLLSGDVGVLTAIRTDRFGRRQPRIAMHDRGDFSAPPWVSCCTMDSKERLSWSMVRFMDWVQHS